jgi:hypothetical protein
MTVYYGCKVFVASQYDHGLEIIIFRSFFRRELIYKPVKMIACSPVIVYLS